MTNGIWGDFFPVIAFIVSAGLTVFARIKGWNKRESIDSEKEVTNFAKSENKPFIERHRWGLILASACLLLLSFSIIFAPPRLTGEIPSTPNQPGRPFYSLHWIRDFFNENSNAIENWSNFIIGLFCLIQSGTAIRRHSAHRTEAALLFSSLSLAILAQWTLAKDEIIAVGAILYIISILGLVYWAWLTRHRISTDLSIHPGKPAWEIIILLGLLALTAFARFYALESVPYGIEGDEAKWTSEAVNLGILGQPDTSGEYHRDALPVSFYLQTPFHRFFGPGLSSARLAVASLSILASLIFYWLLRQIAPTTFALISTYLLAISIFDISASRLANVESYVKLLSILPFALLAWALQKRAWQAYCLVGFSLALAALTYDTLWPILIICIVLTLIELRNQPAAEKYKSFSGLLAPILLTLPVVIPYFTSRINYYGLEDKGWDGNWLSTFSQNVGNVLESWFVILRPDFLYNRAGPLLNSILLPFLVLGTFTALFSTQKMVSRWLLLWAGLVILPVPILTNSPLGRVYYPALPAVYGLISIGIIVLWKEIRRSLPPTFKPFLFAFTLVPLIWLPLSNLYIYFNEVSEPDDRRMRREISNIAGSILDDGTLLILPVIPNADEPLNNEYQMIELYMLRNLPAEKVRNTFKRVALEDVMPTISSELTDWEKLIIVLDNETQGAKEQRNALHDGLVHCYPTGKIMEGEYFSQFVITEPDRKNSRCTPVELNFQLESLSRFSWKLSDGNTSSLSLVCNKQRRVFSWIEAEEMSRGAGWNIEINFAPGWTGNGFLMDSYGSQFLGYEFSPEFSGQEFYIWIRTYKRTEDNSPALINVNGETQVFGNTRDDLLNQWIWERTGPFPQNEITRITIARPFNENLKQFMAFFLDALIFTNDMSFSPVEQLTDPLPPVTVPVSPKATSGSFQHDLPPGQYSCSIQMNTGESLVDHFGRLPVQSNIVNLSIP